MMCICGNPANPDVELILLAHVASWVSRVWGGSSPGHIHLCEDCMWRLENAAGNAIAETVSVVMRAAKEVGR